MTTPPQTCSQGGGGGGTDAERKHTSETHLRRTPQKEPPDTRKGERQADTLSRHLLKIAQIFLKACVGKSDIFRDNPRELRNSQAPASHTGLTQTHPLQDTQSHRIQSRTVCCVQMASLKQGTGKSQIPRQSRTRRAWGGESEGRQAGKHSGLQNNPGFEMLEMLDSGPFLKLGREGGGREQANLELPAQGGVQGPTEVVQPPGEGDP